MSVKNGAVPGPSHPVARMHAPAPRLGLPLRSQRRNVVRDPGCGLLEEGLVLAAEGRAHVAHHEGLERLGYLAADAPAEGDEDVVGRRSREGAEVEKALAPPGDIEAEPVLLGHAFLLQAAESPEPRA